MSEEEPEIELTDEEIDAEILEAAKAEAEEAMEEFEEEAEGERVKVKVKKKPPAPRCRKCGKTMEEVSSESFWGKKGVKYVCRTCGIGKT